MLENIFANGLKAPILNSLNNAWRTALFMEAMRNLNWSRGYCWYCELDGVPSPFHRGGVLGLPAKSVGFTLANGSPLTWESSTISLSVPQRCENLSTIQLDLMDDEQGTLRMFFERWYNQVYNPYKGVLPVTEACKQLTIYYQKSTRRNLKRVYYDIDNGLSVHANGLAKDILKKVHNPSKETEGMDFLVYPTQGIQQNLNADQNGLIEFNVQLQVAHFINQDFGNPNRHDGVTTILDTVVGVSDGTSWLDKIADYI